MSLLTNIRVYYPNYERNTYLQPLTTKKYNVDLFQSFIKTLFPLRKFMSGVTFYQPEETSMRLNSNKRIHSSNVQTVRQQNVQSIGINLGQINEFKKGKH